MPISLMSLVKISVQRWGKTDGRVSCPAEMDDRDMMVAEGRAGRTQKWMDGPAHLCDSRVCIADPPEASVCVITDSCVRASWHQALSHNNSHACCVMQCASALVGPGLQLGFTPAFLISHSGSTALCIAQHESGLGTWPQNKAPRPEHNIYDSLRSAHRADGS